MAYDEALTARIREALAGRSGVTEMKMFGGVGFMLNGNMCCGVVKDELMVRVGRDAHEEAVMLPHARPMDFTGRPMGGFVFVGLQGVQGEDALQQWVERGVSFAGSLPPK